VQRSFRARSAPAQRSSVTRGARHSPRQHSRWTAGRRDAPTRNGRRSFSWRVIRATRASPGTRSARVRIGNPLHGLSDGLEALAFPRGTGSYAEAALPQLVPLDLHLPRKNGREVLGQMKRHSALREIPVVIPTGSRAEADACRSLEVGAAGSASRWTSASSSGSFTTSRICGSPSSPCGRKSRRRIPY
jgi:CheY-like chemotaxis protein